MASRRIRVAINGIDRHVEKTVRRLQLRLYQVLTSESPVDTGFFRAGWSPSSGAPDRSSPVDPPAGGPEAAAAAAPGLQSRHAQAAQALAASYKLAEGSVWIVNNVRYGVYLNAGSSAQAPALFVERAVASVVASGARGL